jgi:HEAT repeat protein
MMCRMKLFNLAAISLFLISSVELWGSVKQDENTLEKLKTVLGELAVYDYGSRSWLEDFRHVMAEIYASPKLQVEAETMLIDFLQSDASVAGKQVVCYQLGNLSTARSIPTLSGLLGNRDLSEMALYVLEKIPDISVDKILRDQLKKADDVLKPRIIRSIGVRKDPKAVKILEEYAHNPDNNISTSATFALAQVGNAQAAKALGKSFIHHTPPLKWEVADHYLIAADQLFESGDEERCFPIFQEVYGANPPLSIKIAALQGMLKDPIIRAQAVILNILNSGDLPFIRAAMPVIRDYPGTLNFKEFEETLNELPTEEQMLLMIAFSGRGDMAVRPLALQSLASMEPESRMAGLISLANLGDPEDALTFARKASETTGDEKEFTRKCLYEMKGNQTDRIILEAIPAAGTDNKVELIRSIGERNMKTGTPLMLELAKNPERPIRLEAIRALGTVGDPEILQELISLLLDAPGRAERNELVKALTLVANKKTSEVRRTDELLAAIPGTKDPEACMALIEVLGNIGSDEALPVLRKFLNDPNPEIQYATIKALSIWPNDAPVMDLKELTEESDDIKKHTLALQGYVQLLSQSNALEPDRKMLAYRKVFEIAINPDEKKMVLSAVGKSGSVMGLEMAVGLLKEKDLQQEAQACFLTLLENIPDQHQEEKRRWIDEALDQSRDENFKDQILEIMNEDN